MLVTLYRASPFKSSNPSPLTCSKYEQTKRCLQSFLSTKPEKIIFLLDSYDDRSLFEPHGEIINCTGLGNLGTFQKQIEVASNIDDDVFFVEDDYLWLPDTFKHIKEAIKTLDFVSPYDHPGHYLEPRFDKHYEMTLIEGRTYREAPSNTLTFAMRSEIAKKTTTTMLRFGTSDHPMFEYLRKDMYLRIWNPVPSFATHLVNGMEAPNVNWCL